VIRLVSATAVASPAGDARAEARRILAERKYRGTDLPRPLHGFLEWLGRRFHFVGRFWGSLGEHVPGGNRLLWTVLAAAIVALAAWAAMRLARRRVRRRTRDVEAVTGARETDPRELERLADEAERRGDLEIALRLRFRAGLVRLGRAHALELRPSITTGEVRRALRNERFDRLARSFDEVVYGRRPPRTDDVAAARAEWPRVLEEVRP
jgi:Domain of unknown function (DUF4129)